MWGGAEGGFGFGDDLGGLNGGHGFFPFDREGWGRAKWTGKKKKADGCEFGLLETERREVKRRMKDVED